jgi:enamine deaminase RidA (YjgF/YER057c/UK114 family)
MEMADQRTPEANLAALGISLPPAPSPAGSYVSSKQVDNLVYLSGVISTDANGIITGSAGVDRSVEEGYAAARACGLTLLAVLKRDLGSLDRVAEVVAVTGYVNAGSGFGDSPGVINGASDLLVQVFGEAGRHVRAALGVSALPRNALVEVQMTVRVNKG